jgi:glutaminyl-peptide cyclotransferase
MRIYIIFLILLLSVACKENPRSNENSMINGAKSPTTTKSNSKLPVYSYEIVNTFNHDPKAFTQGLVFRDGFLYESTGQRGESTLRKVELKTGKVLEKRDLANEFFGEGMTILGDTIYQITWQSGIAFSYNLSDFKLLRQFRYSGEGWGLTNDGTNLLMSDGTHVIRIVDPETFKTIKTIVVLDENGKPLFKINELEYIKGEIWANVWHSEDIGKPNHIARIDPATGKLLGWINLDGISPDDTKRDDENTLNGIAYDADADRIFVTGKNWKKLFEIKLKEPN